ncbi:TonB-dependent receptor domain-containing protein [Thermophagus sp. OGC60D27]
MKPFIIAALLLILTFTSYAQQKGTIRGTVFDGSTGETLVGVSVVIKDPFTGTATDLDGKFSLDIAPGTYQLQLSFISFQPLIIKDVVVRQGEITLLNNLTLSQSTVELKDVVVTAKVIRNTEAALNTMKAKSSVILDGISAAKIELIGDGTAVEAAKRVTGVSIEEGKYVYVRGLGDRYSKTTLNNMDIPGLDPDRNTLQMDIFPTSIMDNMVVSKNFTADLPADFTGGLMNVTTKDFPDKKIFSLSVSTAYNPNVHFNSKYLSYDGGSTDFLGFDDGTRAMPDYIPPTNQLVPSSSNATTVNQFVNQFSPTLAANRRNSLMDYSASLSFGNQIEMKGNGGKSPRLGYIFSLSYKSKYKYDDDVLYADYQKTLGDDNFEMIYSTRQSGAVGERHHLIGLLGGIAYKNKLHKIQLTAMRLQNSISSAGKFSLNNNSSAVGQSGYHATSDQLNYNQRSLTNILLHGNHLFEKNKWKLDWRFSPTFSTSDDPDIRKTAFTHEGGEYLFSAGAAGFPSRIWRELSEFNVSAKIDLSKKYNIFNHEAIIKVGAAHNYKSRDYDITKMGYQFTDLNLSFDEPDASLVLLPGNIYGYGDGNTYILPEKSPSNSYNSNVNNTAFYISNEFYPIKKLKTILGIRMENYGMRHTGQDQNGSRVLNNEKVLESSNLFPSINLIYEVTDHQNIRGGYSKTVARPSFKELSFAQIIDPISNTIFNGGLYAVDDWDGELHETYINNFDLRWEVFGEKGQNISASVFYKQFDDPIELVRLTSSFTSTEYQPRNVGDGQLYGFELEFSKNLDFISPIVKNFNISGNVTLTRSQIEMTNSEYLSRKKFEKNGETIDQNRDMAGQSPYVINAGFSYNNYEEGWATGLFYNVKGSTLSIVGGGVFPDIYTERFHSLNFSLNKKLGKNKKTKIDFKVSNILDQTRESFFKSYKAENQPYSIHHPGRELSIGISHRF